MHAAAPHKQRFVATIVGVGATVSGGIIVRGHGVLEQYQTRLPPCTQYGQTHTWTVCCAATRCDGIPICNPGCVCVCSIRLLLFPCGAFQSHHGGQVSKMGNLHGLQLSADPMTSSAAIVATMGLKEDMLASFLRIPAFTCCPQVC